MNERPTDSAQSQEIDKRQRISERLRPGSTIQQRLQTFTEMGLRPVDVSSALGVSTETLRQWAKGGSARHSNSAPLDDLGALVLVLLERDDPQSVVDWLTTPPAKDAKRPIDLVRERPQDVAAAAQAHVAGNVEGAVGLLLSSANLLRPASNSEAVAAPLPLSNIERSSTQLTRHLLATLSQIAAGHTSSHEVMAQIETQYRSVMDGMSNYSAYRQLVDDLKAHLADNQDKAVDEAIDLFVSKKKAAESKLLEFLSERAKELVEPKERIMTYALSMRVVQTLRAVEREIQGSCRVLVCECGVKSTPPLGRFVPFADAAEMLRYLDRTAYEKMMVPDGAAASLMERKTDPDEREVTQLMLGAQKIYVVGAPQADDDLKDQERGGLKYYVVATVGTRSLLRTARDLKIRVSVLGESSKIVHGKPEDDQEFSQRRREQYVRLPQEGSPVAEYATLLTISEEVCEILPHEIYIGSNQREEPDESLSEQAPRAA